MLLLASAAAAQKRIGEIEFFGSKGMDVDHVRAALPVHEGDAAPESAAVEDGIRAAVERATGMKPTNVALGCCDSGGDWTIYIGLAGASSRQFSYNPPPTGTARLPASLSALYRKMEGLVFEAVEKGISSEDDSHGYALFEYPPLRSCQLQMREIALANEQVIRSVLETSAAPQHRQAAAQALGYARQSPEQIAALVHASRDPDDTVRNNATRALVVLARSSPVLAGQIPAQSFIDMLSSGTWTDRNKSGAVLEVLTKSRDPKLLAALRAQALDALLEMARWRNPGHAFFARMILGRMAGIEESRIDGLPTAEILAAVERSH